MADLMQALTVLLPKGIVFDDPEIYAEVAQLPVVPLEDIRRHWHVYTTLHKKSHDPTAYRLECFWWHVWGSDRRKLSGKTLARLWQQIASGPTFVPLRGPENRYDRPPIPPRNMHESDPTQLPEFRESRSQQHETEAAPPKGTPQNLTPSSSRPPPSHPILKKPRGPSNSGPRPTARFDVPDSEEETSRRSDRSNLESTNKNKVDASSRPRSPPKADKKPAATTKKFVASTTTSKRRPVLPRRQGSQSSTGSVNGSDSASRDGSSYGSKNTNDQPRPASSNEDSNPRRQGSSGLPTHLEELAPGAKALEKRPAVNNTNPTLERRTVSNSGQQSSTRAASANTAMQQVLSSVPKRQSGAEDCSRPQVSSRVSHMSPKALGKQPELAGTTAATAGKQTCTRGRSQPDHYDGATGTQPSISRTTLQSTTPAASSQRRGDFTVAGRKEGAQKSTAGPQKEMAGDGDGDGDASASASVNAAPPMVRSKSNESKRMSSGPLPAANFKAASVVGMSSVAVSGGFDFETPRAKPLKEDLPPLGPDQPDIPRTVSLLDTRTMTPTQPSSAPAPPMGRSKSQLTLLLERDNARIGDRHKVGSSNTHKSEAGKEG